MAMESSRSSRPEREERPLRRSRSHSYDSDEERRRRRRRKEHRLEEDREKTHGRDKKDRNRDTKGQRWRSHSPEYESSSGRRNEDSETKHRARARERSPGHHYREGRGSRTPRDEAATQISRKNNSSLPSQEASFQSSKHPGAVVSAEQEQEKQKPNFAPTGLLAAASNSVAQADGSSIVLKYHEPSEARKPSTKDEWKLFVFKGAEILDTIELSTRSCWLVGRELAVVDMAAEHPSVSKQHAAVQFRYVEKKNEFGDKLGKVRPYLIDLESANGTSLNKDVIAPSRYVELRDKDMIQFGDSTREYVLMLSPKG